MTVQKNVKVAIFIVSILFVTSFPAYSEVTISPEDAVNYIGQSSTVCGVVASTTNDVSHVNNKRHPTLLSLNQLSSGRIFTVFIHWKDRSKFSSSLESTYNNKSICVTGKIRRYKGIPTIIVKKTSQILIH